MTRKSDIYPSLDVLKRQYTDGDNQHLALTYLRIFGHNRKSLARFPFEQLDVVKQILYEIGYREMPNFEYVGEILIYSKRRTDYIEIIRHNGEPMFNIVYTTDLDWSITDIELQFLVDELHKNNINVQLPREDNEYIPPINCVNEKYLFPKVEAIGDSPITVIYQHNILNAQQEEEALNKTIKRNPVAGNMRSTKTWFDNLNERLFGK